MPGLKPSSLSPISELANRIIREEWEIRAIRSLQRTVTTLTSDDLLFALLDTQPQPDLDLVNELLWSDLVYEECFYPTYHILLAAMDLAQSDDTYQEIARDIFWRYGFPVSLLDDNSDNVVDIIDIALQDPVDERRDYVLQFIGCLMA